MKAAIRIDRLGKRYPVGVRRERYLALRDVVTDAVRKPVRVLRSLLRGGARRENIGHKFIWALKDVSVEFAQGGESFFGAGDAGMRSLIADVAELGVEAILLRA